MSIVFSVDMSTRRESWVSWKRGLSSFGEFVTFWSSNDVFGYLLLIDRRIVLFEREGRLILFVGLRGDSSCAEAGRGGKNFKSILLSGIVLICTTLVRRILVCLGLESCFDLVPGGVSRVGLSPRI